MIINYEGLGSEPELNPGLRLVPVQDVSQAEFLEVVRASLKDCYLVFSALGLLFGGPPEN